jgi:hypothetical protein
MIANGMAVYNGKDRKENRSFISPFINKDARLSMERNSNGQGAT